LYTSDNDNDGIASKLQTAFLAQELNQARFSPSLQAEKQLPAGPPFEDIGPVHVLSPQPKRRKNTFAVLTDKEHLSQAKMLRQKLLV
jgi:hypothetical protein